MTDRAVAIDAIANEGLIAIVRLTDTTHIVEITTAIAEGGIKVIEVTLNSGNALNAIERCAHALPDEVLIGAGTVLTTSDVQDAADSGARFIVSPDTNPEVIQATHERGLVGVPGALTPTEVAAAMAAGADYIKLFPADAFGPPYLKTLRGPLNTARFIPTGGVTPKNVQEYLRAGAAALAVGGSLINDDLMTIADFPAITRRSARFRDALDEARVAQ